jgi:hypothetical protein
LRWLHRHFKNTPAPASFPARLPLLALDRIWIKPREFLLSVAAHNTPLARLASDHLPVVARIALPLSSAAPYVFASTSGIASASCIDSAAEAPPPTSKDILAP